MESKAVFQVWNDSGSSAAAETQGLEIWDLSDESIDRLSRDDSDCVLTCCCVNQVPQD